MSLFLEKNHILNASSFKRQTSITKLDSFMKSHENIYGALNS